MQLLRFLFSPNGVLRPRAFVLGALVVYAAGLASQWLTVPDFLMQAGLLPFALAQVLLIWVWYSLHAKRLRDAGRTAGLAAAISLLYALSIVLLLIVSAAFLYTPALADSDANTTSALGLILLVSILALLSSTPHYDFEVALIVGLTALGFLPIVVALIFTMWTATRPSKKEEQSA